MASKCLRGYAGLAALLLSSCAIRAQPITTNQIKIVASTDGVTPSGIDVPTNATMPNTGAYRIHGNINKENATIDSFGGPTIFPGLYVTHSEGTEASPSPVAANANIAIFAGGGWDGAAFQRARGRMYYYNCSGSVWTTISTPICIGFATTAGGGTTPTLRWVILDSGDIIPNGSGTYRIGYLTSRLSEFYSIAADLSGALTFNSGAGAPTLSSSSTTALNLGGTHGTAFRPIDASATNTLGDAGHVWGNTYTGNIEVQNVNNSGATVTFQGPASFNSSLTTGSVVPVAGSTYQVGLTGTRYLAGWFIAVDAVGYAANGSAGVTSATCSSFKAGICIAP